MPSMSETGARLRVHLAEYEAHREREPNPDTDPDANWWYAAWAQALVPVLREVIAAGEDECDGADR